jgi:Tfp pilus assembly protein PilO
MTRRTRRLDIRQAGRQILITFGVVVALNVVFYVTLTQPAVRQYRRQTTQHEPFQKLNERREQVEAREAFFSGVQQAQEDLEHMQQEILSTRNGRLVDVQQELARLCDRFGIDLDSVASSSDLLLDEELDRFSMNVPLEGNYQNLRKFLQAVEESDKFLVVERVSLARGKEGGSELSLNINLATYFAAPQELVERKRAIQRRRRG